MVHVVAGVVFDAAGRLLIAQRPEGKHLAGGWEFPGGKLEPGEERQVGLARELHEELGITIGTPRPLIRIRHAYPTRDILLDVWVVRSYEGEPRGLDDQALRWCSREELATVELLPADGPIVRALWLPERLREAATPEYVIHGVSSKPAWSDRKDVTPDTRLNGVFCAGKEQAVAAAGTGADFIVLSGRLAMDEIEEVCRAVSLPVYAREIALESAWALGASGVNEIDV